jgi:hypothetical protein
MEFSVIYAGAGFFKALHVRLIGNAAAFAAIAFELCQGARRS